LDGAGIKYKERLDDGRPPLSLPPEREPVPIIYVRQPLSVAA
jgi:hypothetical protein